MTSDLLSRSMDLILSVNLYFDMEFHIELILSLSMVSIQSIILDMGNFVFLVADPCISIDEMVQKFGNGSVHGKFDGEVSHQDGKLIINGQQVAVFNE